MALASTIYRRIRREWVRRTQYSGAPAFSNPARVAGYRNTDGDPDFMPTMVPWLDRPDADIDAYMRTVADPLRDYDLRDKLHAWRRDGYVLFEQAVDHRLIEAYRADMHELLQHHKDHDQVRVDHKLYNGPSGSVSL